MKTLALILARGGSKAIPDKNIVPLCGRPLIHYTIDAALNAEGIEEVLLSTDSERIAGVAADAGLVTEYRRPPELAQDDTPSIDAALHAIQWLHDRTGAPPERVVLLQPTSPLRTAADITAALHLYDNDNVQTLISVHEMHEHPRECIEYTGPGQWQYLRPLSRQECGRQRYTGSYYFMNGAIYINKTSYLINERTFVDESAGLYVMPRERGFDVDDSEDLAMAEFLMSHKQQGMS
jgi:CMP-N-acetylneuraminic acid synthetase